ncbi:MAG: HlyD family efflux transporter periplasmic adaptor subunit [Acidimicrobiales bacterium]
MTSTATTSESSVEELTDPSETPAERRPRRGRRRVAVGGAVVALAATGVGLWIADLFGGDNADGSAGEVELTSSLATVTEQTLSSQTEVAGTLGYADTYSVVNQAQGTLTAVPAAGQVVEQGQSLYQVNGSPVVLFHGSMPAYRGLSIGMSGMDVKQLNANLVDLGYATTSELDPESDTFSWATATALEELQTDLGREPAGSLALGEAVFLPADARITTIQATLGALAPPGTPVLQATSTSRVVTVALDAAQQAEVEVGDRVTITLPDDRTTPGAVASVATVVTGPSSSQAGAGAGSSAGEPSQASGDADEAPTIEVQVTLDDPAAAGSLDEAPVQVTITTATVEDVLVVPVVSLLAQADQGYAVEVVDEDGVHDLVPVTLGLFDAANGLVEVTETELTAGQRVVVPDL